MEATLTNDIHDPERVPFIVRESVEAVLKAQVRHAREKGLDLLFQVDPGVPRRVLGDPVRLNRLITDLAENAIRFTTRGSVTVRICVESRDGNGTLLHFTVTGTGIAPAISMNLSTMINGRLRVESAPGSGSTYHFTAFFAPADAGENLPEEGEDLIAGAHAVVIEESGDGRGLLATLAASWNMNAVSTSRSGEAIRFLAEALIQHEQLPVVIADSGCAGIDLPAFIGTVRESEALRGAPIIVTGSASLTKYEEANACCAEVGSGDSIRRAIARSLISRPLPGQGTAPGPVESERVPREAPQAQPGNGTRVLLAEDHPVNQEFATAILEMRGFTVELASNGREAVEKYARGPFDVVLMDIQMPELDGFEATAAIRKMEGQSGRRTPIIALTAHAIKGYREECLAAGMDGYLTKPINGAALFAMIDELVSLRKEITGKVPPPAETGVSHREIFDVVTALEQCMGNEQLLNRMAGLFRGTAPGLIESIRGAIANRDAGALRTAAHTLKGSAGTLYAGSVGASSLCLEKIGRSGNLEGAEEALAALERSYALLDAALAAFISHSLHTGQEQRT